MVYRADIHTRDKITSVFWKRRMKIWVNVFLISSVQFSCLQSLSCAWLLWPQGLQHARFSVHHQLQELAQTHVHRVDDAIKPSLPLSPPSPPAFNLSWHHGLFQWVRTLHQVTEYLKVSTKILLVLSIKLHNTKLIYWKLLLFYTLIMNYQKEKGNNLI